MGGATACFYLGSVAHFSNVGQQKIYILGKVFENGCELRLYHLTPLWPSVISFLKKNGATLVWFLYWFLWPKKLQTFFLSVLAFLEWLYQLENLCSRALQHCRLHGQNKNQAKFNNLAAKKVYWPKFHYPLAREEGSGVTHISDWCKLHWEVQLHSGQHM